MKIPGLSNGLISIIESRQNQEQLRVYGGDRGSFTSPNRPNPEEMGDRESPGFRQFSEFFSIFKSVRGYRMRPTS